MQPLSSKKQHIIGGRKNMKRYSIFMLVVCIALIFSILAGCASTPDQETSEPQDNDISEKPSNNVQENEGNDEDASKEDFLWQTMVVATNPEFEINSNMWIFQEREKLHNMNFEIEVYGTDQWGEQKNLLFASDDLPDVLMSGLTNDEVITYSQAGQLIAITDLLKDNAPNYMKHLNEHPDGKKLYAPDGEMYGLAGTFTGGSAETPGARAFINKEWADNVGKELPNTYDEFYDLLVEFRDSNPKQNDEEVYPLSGVADSYKVDAFVANPLGIQMQHRDKSQFQAIDGEIQHLIDMPIYEEYLKRMYQLYDEKLLDNEYYTQNVAQFRAKGANMLLGSYAEDAHFVNIGSTDPELYGQYEITYPLTSEYQEEPVWYGDVVSTGNIYLTSVNENPDKTIEYLDYFWTEEGAELICGPVKGKWDGEGGIVWNEDGTSFTYDIPEGFNGIWEWLCKEVSTVAFLQGSMQFSDIKAKEEKSPEDAAFKDLMEERTAEHVIPNFPHLFFTIEEQEKIALILNDVTTHFEQMESKMVMGEVDIENGIKETKEYLDGLGLGDLTTIYQAAYDRYIDN